MPQFLRPDADVTTTNWTRSSGTASYFTYVDEVTPDNTDYVQTTNTNSGLELGLSNVTDPNTSSGHIVRIRDWSVGSGAGEARTVILLQGTTTIATIASGNPTRTVGNQVTYTLTSTEAGNITDYTNLRLRFTATTLGAGESYRVGWAEMEVPDAVVTRYVLVT